MQTLHPTPLGQNVAHRPSLAPVPSWSSLGGRLVPRPPDRKMDPDGRLYHTGVKAPSPPQPHPVLPPSFLFHHLSTSHPPSLNSASSYSRYHSSISWYHLYQPTVAGVILMLFYTLSCVVLMCRVDLSMLPAWLRHRTPCSHIPPLCHYIYYQQYWQIWNCASYLCSFLPNSMPDPLVYTP